MIEKYFPLDKQLHFMVGLLIAAMLRAVGISGWIVLFAVFVIGTGKEIYDHFNRERHTPEVADAVVTYLGGLIGIAIVEGISWINAF